MKIEEVDGMKVLIVDETEWDKLKELQENPPKLKEMLDEMFKQKLTWADIND